MERKVHAGNRHDLAICGRWAHPMLLVNIVELWQLPTGLKRVTCLRCLRSLRDTNMRQAARAADLALKVGERLELVKHRHARRRSKR